MERLTDLAAESTLARKMAAGQFVVTMELVPPRTPELAGLRTRIEKYFLGHCDALNITDCASALLRMSSLGASLACLEMGAEPVMQITCRDRNRIAIQSELITAYAFGVRNILCLTGDHVIFGDHPMAKPVFDLDSTNLIAMVSQMRSAAKFASGEEIKATPKSAPIALNWLIGGAANPMGNDPRHLAMHMNKKMRAGADFLQTQPVYDLAGFDRWMKAMIDLGLHEKIKILPGVLPPKSAKGLGFMKDNVPGMRVPDELIRRLEGAQDPAEEGKKLTLEIIEALLNYPIAGLHVYPVYWEALMPELGAAIRDLAAKAGRALPEPETATPPEPAALCPN
ncbi:MAG TPA: methylenetetrahydrofolate reductase [Candidatus Sumerlaeota bacterium]|nr:methylenetetrahydrofolate reductase [Candidatus Sumerlaeota bacterium]